MSRVERHPGTFGLKRPVRSVSMGQAWADALLVVEGHRFYQNVDRLHQIRGVSYE